MKLANQLGLTSNYHASTTLLRVSHGKRLCPDKATGSLKAATFQKNLNPPTKKNAIYTHNNLRAILAADSERFSIHKLDSGPKKSCQEGKEAKEHFVVKVLFGERF